MSLRTILAQLYLLQQSIRVSDPEATPPPRVYKYSPDPNDVLTDMPCWTNEITFNRQFIGVGLHELFWTNHMQLFVAKDPRDFNHSIDLAQAMFEEFITQWEAHLNLGNTTAEVKLTGGNPTVGIFQRGQIYYAGVDLFLEMNELNSVDFTDSVLQGKVS